MGWQQEALPLKSSKPKPEKLTPKGSSMLPRCKHIREKVFSCHTLGCLAKDGKMTDDDDLGGGDDEDDNDDDDDLAKAGKMEGVLRVPSTKVPPDPVN